MDTENGHQEGGDDFFGSHLIAPLQCGWTGCQADAEWHVIWRDQEKVIPAGVWYLHISTPYCSEHLRSAQEARPQHLLAYHVYEPLCSADDRVDYDFTQNRCVLKWEPLESDAAPYRRHWWSRRKRASHQAS